ncbi:MAG: two-component system sensor histidine kinase NtrB, partial [Gemmatimonadales bacterium]
SLRWVYVGRVCLATAVYLAAVLKWQIAEPLDLLVVSLLMVGTLVFTAFSFWFSHMRETARIGQTFLYAQALFDVSLVTTVVHLTGGPQSDFSSAYILVIAASALWMPAGSALLLTLFACIVYFADAVVFHETEITPALIIQLSIFAVVASATSFLGTRVRQATTERRSLESELRQVRLEAADILRNIRTGVLTVDDQGRLAYANPAAEELLGIRESEWHGLPFLPELKRIAPDFEAALLTTTRRKIRVMRGEALVRLPHRSFPVGITTTMVEPSDEGPGTVTAIFTDISDQKRLEDLRRRAERLQAVAELSASLAHEIRNPLASIRSSVEQLSRSARANDDERFLAQLIMRESDRLTRILGEFLDFSRVRVTDRRSLDLLVVAREAVRLVREHPDCPRKAAIEIAGDATVMEGDEDLLHRVVRNLVLNAVQAGGPEVRVTVRTARVAASDLPRGATLENPVLLEVSDNGPGIPEHLLERLFEPFVTGRVGGTGLGLAIVERAVQAHNGLVLVDSKPGQGTRFAVYFPSKAVAEAAA